MGISSITARNVPYSIFTASYPKTASHFLGRAAFFSAPYAKTATHFLGRAASSRD
jgi:hypothetical protein